MSGQLLEARLWCAEIQHDAETTAATDDRGRALNIAAEVAYLKGKDLASFERPYGLAWLLQLAAELRSWNDPQAEQWASTLRPLESI